jgi:hypothetical protein
LGHIVIPWHSGNIIDAMHNHDPECSSIVDDNEMESEAHRFASELLMPEEWVQRIIARRSTVIDCLGQIAFDANVSFHAASIRLIKSLPAGYIYANVSRDGIVITSGRSENTFANAPEWGSRIVPEEFLANVERSMYTLASETGSFYWWVISRTKELPSFSAGPSWRELLDAIFRDLNLNAALTVKMKQSINGVIASANGRLTGRQRSREALYDACLQRFHSRDQYRSFLAHKLFIEFLIKRVDELIT